MFIHLAKTTNFLPVLSYCIAVFSNSAAHLSLNFYHLLNSRYENHLTEVSIQI